MPTSKLRSRTVERQTLAEQVYASTKKAIVEGDLLPGERLKELELAESLGASRTPVREALSRLEQEGLLSALPSGGLTVVQHSEAEVREIFSLIRLLEGYAARLAAERATPAELDKLDALCQLSEQVDPGEADRLIDLNRRFHEQMIEASGHRRLKGILGTLRSAMQPYRLMSLESPEARAMVVRDHREMVRALREKDLERLVRLINEHMGRAEKSTLEHVWALARRVAAKP